MGIHSSSSRQDKTIIMKSLVLPTLLALALLAAITSAANIRTGDHPMSEANGDRTLRAVPFPVPFGDLLLQTKKVAKKSCLAAHLLGIDDDIHPCGEDDDVAGFTNQLPPIYIPAPTMRESVAGPLSAMGAFLILAGIAMAAAYLASSNNINQQRRSYSTFDHNYYNYDIGRNIVPLLETAYEKY